LNRYNIFKGWRQCSRIRILHCFQISEKNTLQAYKDSKIAYVSSFCFDILYITGFLTGPLIIFWASNGNRSKLVKGRISNLAGMLWPLHFWALKANSSKLVKATDLQFANPKTTLKSRKKSQKVSRICWMSIEILASKLSDVMGTYRRLSHGCIHGYIHGYIHVWIWDLCQDVDIGLFMDITLAQHYSIKPMQNSSKLQTTY